MEIAEKLRDALSMFWQSLDTEERRLLIGGVAYLVVAVVTAVGNERRRQWEREEIADAVARRLTVGS